jgi:hypothetical protein
MGSVTSNSPGMERIERVSVDTVCSASPCTITRQSAGIASVTRASMGRYTVNFSPPFGGTPTCSGSASGLNGAVLSRDAESASAMSFYGFGGTVLADVTLSIICMGPR